VYLHVFLFNSQQNYCMFHQSLLHVCILFIVDDTVYVKPIEPSCSSRQREEEKKEEEEKKDEKEEEKEKSEGKFLVIIYQISLSCSFALSLPSNYPAMID
jgi:p-aminobenzoyl-glutamate transporter AbgT